MKVKAWVAITAMIIIAWALISFALFFIALKIVHAQPCFPDNIVAGYDTTIWTAPDYCTELQLKISVKNDTILYIIPQMAELGLRVIVTKTDTVTNHALISWFDALARLMAQQKGIKP
jgi:hypothetical protein